MSTFACDNCIKVFDDKSKLARHKKPHLIENIFCQQCGGNFRNKQSFSAHFYKENWKCSKGNSDSQADAISSTSSSSGSDLILRPFCQIVYLNVARVQAHISKVFQFSFCLFYLNETRIPQSRKSIKKSRNFLIMAVSKGKFNSAIV
jgi:hypothetical protein